MATSVTDGTNTLYPIHMTVYSTTRASNTVAHTIVGRTSGIPDITFGAMGARTGTLIFRTADYPSAAALEAMFTQQLTFTFNVSEVAGLTWPFAVVGNLAVELEDVEFPYYLVSVDFLETV
jgi:hypothetical protein